MSVRSAIRPKWNPLPCGAVKKISGPAQLSAEIAGAFFSTRGSIQRPGIRDGGEVAKLFAQVLLPNQAAHDFSALRLGQLRDQANFTWTKGRAKDFHDRRAHRR